MKAFKKAITIILAAVLALSMSACDPFGKRFVDYDVSGYIQALLDSSYHDDHDAIKELAGITDEQAEENCTTTVANAAVRFCNTYGVSPTVDQLRRIEVVMKQAYAVTKYTVKEERKVDTGYYLEVEIASITNFEGRKADIEALRAQAKAEADAANAPKTTPTPEPKEDEENEDIGEGDDTDNESSETPEEQTPDIFTEKVDANELFVEKLIDMCIREVANVSYDSDTISIHLDILLTDEGELKLDMNQIETIDKMVIRF